MLMAGWQEISERGVIEWLS